MFRSTLPRLKPADIMERLYTIPERLDPQLEPF